MSDRLAGESIVCFAGEDWWYHHPHSKNHLLKRYALRNKVLFVNSITMGLPSMANPDFFLKIKRKFKSYLRWLRKVPEGLWVMTPVNLPFYGSRLGRWVNRILLVAQLRLAMQLLGMARPILWVAIPTAGDMAGRLEEKVLLYQVSDKYDANEDSALATGVIRAYDRRLKAAADVVLYSGRKLFGEATEANRYFLEQAVDYEHFAYLPCESAAELNGIRHPILGYFGSMDYVMDTELMAEVARLRPQWHWVLLGLRSNLVQVTAPNIHFFGSKPYRDLPRYISQFDVCVLPWRAQNAFTSYGSAIKVREYLATGKPVVMAPLYEYLETPGLRFYQGAEEFIAQVEAALQDDTPELAAKRQAVVKGGTWDARADQLAALIHSLLQGKPYQHASAISPGTTRAYWKGTASAVPQKVADDWALAPEVRLLAQPSEENLYLSGKSRSSYQA